MHTPHFGGQQRHLWQYYFCCQEPGGLRSAPGSIIRLPTPVPNRETTQNHWQRAGELVGRQSGCE